MNYNVKKSMDFLVIIKIIIRVEVNIFLHLQFLRPKLS